MLSILIPYYKKVFFELTLNSLDNQTNKNFNVYIFDDNSPECPNQLIEEYKKKINIKYFKFSNNLGGNSLVQHWERCLEKIENTQWLIILGDDDVLGENVVQCFFENINDVNKLKISLIRYSTIVIDSKDNKISKKHEHPLIEKSTTSLIRKIKNETRSSLSEYIFKYEVFKNYKIIDLPNALFSDDLMLLNHSDFQNLYSINAATVFIRRSEFNLSGGFLMSNRHIAIIKFYKILLLDLKNNFEKFEINLIEKKFEKELFNHKKIEIGFFFIGYYIRNFKILSLIRYFFTIIKKTIKHFF